MAGRQEEDTKRELKELSKITKFVQKHPCLKAIVNTKGFSKWNAAERRKLNYIIMLYCHSSHSGTLPTSAGCKRAIKKYLRSRRTQACLNICCKNKASKELLLEFIQNCCNNFCRCQLKLNQIGGGVSLGEVGDFAEKTGISDVTKAVAKELAADQIRENAISGAIGVKSLNSLISTSGQFFDN